MFMLNYSNIIDPLLRDLRDLITEMVDIKPNKKIIDVCCGDVPPEKVARSYVRL